MKRLLSSTRLAVVLGVLFICFSFVLFYTSVPVFSEYGEMVFGIPRFDALFGDFLYVPPPFVALLLGIWTLLFFVLYSLSIWFATDRLKEKPPHRWDFFYTVLVGIALLVLFVEQYVLNRYSVMASILFFTAIFTLFLYLWTTTLIRFHAHTLGDTTSWPKVFMALPPRSFTGAFVLVILCGGTLIFLVNCFTYLSEIIMGPFYLDSQSQYFLERYVATVCLPLVVLVIMSVLSRSIIRLTAERERIMEEKLAAERFRTELIANVTHDIRTPLTSIINYIDLIDKRGGDDAQLKEYVSVLNRKSVRLKSLVNDLLDATKASAGNVDVSIGAIDLAEIIGQVVGDFDDALRTAGLTYVSPDTDHPVMIGADGRHLYRVLENLFANVVKYAMSGTRVYVSIKAAEQTVALSIKNTSKEPLNIAPSELLQQFVRGDEARTAEGNGLGLFISERLTTLMGAQFTLAINADLFEVRLEFARPPAMEASPTAQGGAAARR